MMTFRILALFVTLYCSLQPSYCSWKWPQPNRQPRVDTDLSDRTHSRLGGTPVHSRADKTRLDRLLHIFFRVLPGSPDSTNPGEGPGLEFYLFQSGRTRYAPPAASPPDNDDSNWWEPDGTEPLFPMEDSDSFDEEFPSGQDYPGDVADVNNALGLGGNDADPLGMGGNDADPPGLGRNDGNPQGMEGNDAKLIPAIHKRNQYSQRNTGADVSHPGRELKENDEVKRARDISRWLGEKKMVLDRWYLTERARYRRFKLGFYGYWGHMHGARLGYKLIAKE